MQQIRLYIQLTSPLAQQFFALVEAEFEEEYFPIGILEINESSQLHEVSIYCETNQEDHVSQKLKHILINLGINKEISIELLPTIDWVKHSLCELKPIETNSFFIHGQHDIDKQKSDKINIIIDAGQAFGTGHHDTTIGCVELLEQIFLQNEYIPAKTIDIGTGTGILSITVAKLLEKNYITPTKNNIIASDIDPIATSIADENFITNNVKKYITAVTCEGVNDNFIKNHKPYDLVVANILANPLMELAPNIATIVNNGGYILLSGILNTQSDEVIKVYTDNNFKLLQNISRGEWSILLFTFITK